MPDKPRHSQPQPPAAPKDRKQEAAARLPELKRQLARERARARALMDVAGVMLISLDREARITMLNRKGCELLGLTEDQALGMDWIDNFILPEHRNQIHKIFRQLMDGEIEPVEFHENPVQDTNGKIHHVAWHNSLLHDDSGKIIGILSSGEDITRRHKSEMARLRVESKYRAIFENAPLGIFRTAADGRVLDANPAAARMFGYSGPVELLAEVQNVIEKIYVDPVQRDTVLKALEPGAGIIRTDLRLKRRGGSTFDARVSLAGFIDEDGTPVLDGFIEDITEQNQIQRIREAERNRLSAIFDNSPLGALYISANDHFIYLNKKFTAITGYTLSRIRHMDTWFAKAYPDPELRRQARKKWEHSRATREVAEAAFPVTCADGTVKDIEFQAAFLPDGEAIVTIHDISERKRMEDALKASEDRLSALVSKAPIAIHLYELQADGRLVLLMANPAADAMTNEPGAALMGKDIEEAFPNLADTEIPGVYRRIAATGGTWSARDLYYQYGRINGYYDVYAFRTSPGRMAVMFQNVTARLEAEKKIRDNQERLDMALEAGGLGLWDWDMTTDTVFYDPRWSGMLGYGPDELDNSLEAMSGLTHPEDQDRVNKALALHFDDPSVPFAQEMRLKTKSGQWVWGLSQGKVTERDADGAPLRMVGTIQNVTERKLAQDRAARHRQALETLVELNQGLDFDLDKSFDMILERAIAMTGSEVGFIGFVTPDEQAFTMHAYSNQVMRECRVAQPPINFPLHKAGLWADAARQKEAMAVNDYHAAKGRRGLPDGHVDIERFAVAPALDEGRLTAVIAVAGKPTPYSDMDLNVLTLLVSGVWNRHKRDLHKKELVRAKEAAEAASEAKGQFLANMSHEVRTPLNGVLGMLQLAMTTELDPEQQDYLQTALATGRGLLAVINDVLDFSKMDAGRMELVRDPFDMARTLEMVADSFRYQTQEKGLSLTMETAPSVPVELLGDEARLRQVLFNLVGNAIKFCEQGEIHLGISRLPLAPEGSVRLLFEVSDTGIGIPDNLVEDMFEAFTQADGSSTRRYTGTGLGLGIVRRLVAAMQGDLSVDSEPGQGTRVYFTALFGQSANTAVTGDEPPHLRMDRKTIKVLLAEDEAVNRMAVSRFLEKQGHLVTCAATGREALALAAANDFQCILMDVQMPDMDGMEATRAIRALQSGPRSRTPIIALTAHAMKGDREKFLKAGMDAYLSKPVDLNQLSQTLAELARKKRSE